MPTVCPIMWQSFIGVLPLSLKLQAWIYQTLSQFWTPFEKNCKGHPHPWWGCASKTWSFSSACKNLEAQHSLGAEIWIPKKSIWVGMIPHWDLRNYWTKVHRIFLHNVEGIMVDQILVWFWISSSVPEIFAAEVWSCLISGQILHVLATKIFLGGPPEILDWHYKI